MNALGAKAKHGEKVPGISCPFCGSLVHNNDRVINWLFKNIEKEEPYTETCKKCGKEYKVAMDISMNAFYEVEK